MRHLLKNKDAHTMVNELHYPIPQVQGKKKGYTTHDINGMIVQDSSIISLVSG